jgi:hypothetical protein
VCVCVCVCVCVKTLHQVTECPVLGLPLETNNLFHSRIGKTKAAGWVGEAGPSEGSASFFNDLISSTRSLFRYSCKLQVEKHWKTPWGMASWGEGQAS